MFNTCMYHLPTIIVNEIKGISSLESDNRILKNILVVRACVRSCVRAGVRACVRECACVRL